MSYKTTFILFILAYFTQSIRAMLDAPSSTETIYNILVNSAENHIVFSSDTKVTCKNLATKKILSEYTFPEIVGLALRHDGKQYAVATSNSIHLLPPSERRHNLCVDDTDEICSLTYSSDGDTLFVGTNSYVGEASIYIWNLKESHEPHRIQFDHKDNIYDIMYLAHYNKLIVSRNMSKEIFQKKAPALQLINSQTCNLKVTPKNCRELPQDIDAIALSDDQRIIAIALSEGKIYLWNPATKQVTKGMPAPRDEGDISLAFSHNNKLLAAARGHRMTIQDVTSQKEITSKKYSKNIYCLAFGPHDAWIALGTDNACKPHKWKPKKNKLTKDDLRT